eukprot:2341953-Alexandrium_andersonii.AAC.1
MALGARLGARVASLPQVVPWSPLTRRATRAHGGTSSRPRLGQKGVHVVWFVLRSTKPARPRANKH